jgi:hypothetical protein
MVVSGIISSGPITVFPPRASISLSVAARVCDLHVERDVVGHAGIRRSTDSTADAGIFSGHDSVLNGLFVSETFHSNVSA